MAVSDIFGIFNKVMEWFTPGKVEQRKRARRTALEKEIRKLKKQKWTPELSQKMEKLENELEKINNSLGA